MKRRWIAVLGAMLIGFTVGCEQSQSVTGPEDIPKEPMGAPSFSSETPSPTGNANAQEKP